MIAFSKRPERKQIAPDELGEEMGGTGCTDSHDDDMLIIWTQRDQEAWLVSLAILGAVGVSV